MLFTELLLDIGLTLPVNYLLRSTVNQSFFFIFL
jgi:hypothetical protein